jgi:hypothetical protein
MNGAVKRSFAASLRAFGLEPIDHFAHVFKRAMSVKLILVAAALSGLEVALPYIDEWIVIPRGIFAAVSGLTTMAACIARFTVQSQVTMPKGPDDADQKTSAWRQSRRCRGDCRGRHYRMGVLYGQPPDACQAVDEVRAHSSGARPGRDASRSVCRDRR